MSHNILIRGAAFCAAILLTLPAWSFNYAQYKTGNLDQIIERPRPKTGVQVERPQKLQIDVSLASHPEKCDTGFLKTAMIMLGASKEVVEKTPITKCIKVKSQKGTTTSLFIQDRVAEFIATEVPVGSAFTVFVDFLFVGSSGPGLLVNEFQTKKR